MFAAGASRGADIALRAFQRPFQIELLELFDQLLLGEFERNIGDIRFAARALPAKAQRQVVHLDGVAGLHAGEKSHAVLQLTHVAWPWITQQKGARRFAENNGWDGVLLAIHRREMLEEGGDV